MEEKYIDVRKDVNFVYAHVGRVSDGKSQGSE